MLRVILDAVCNGGVGCLYIISIIFLIGSEFGYGVEILSQCVNESPRTPKR